MDTKMTFHNRTGNVSVDAGLLALQVDALGAQASSPSTPHERAPRLDSCLWSTGTRLSTVCLREVAPTGSNFGSPTRDIFSSPPLASRGKALAKGREGGLLLIIIFSPEQKRRGFGEVKVSTVVMSPPLPLRHNESGFLSGLHAAAITGGAWARRRDTPPAWRCANILLPRKSQNLWWLCCAGAVAAAAFREMLRCPCRCVEASGSIWRSSLDDHVSRWPNTVVGTLPGASPAQTQDAGRGD